MYFWSRATLELGLYLPRKVGLAVFAEDDIVAGCVNVLGIEEQAVHVEEAGANARKPRWR